MKFKLAYILQEIPFSDNEFDIEFCESIFDRESDLEENFQRLLNGCK